MESSNVVELVHSLSAVNSLFYQEVDFIEIRYIFCWSFELYSVKLGLQNFVIWLSKKCPSGLDKM